MFDTAREALKGRADAWLLVNEPEARRLLGLEHLHLTRPFYLFVPREGRPRLLAHALEAPKFKGLDAEVSTFVRHEERRARLAEAIERWPRLAVATSPAASIPSLCRLDLGTAELLRGLGAELVSDAEIALFYARWRAEDLERHFEAARGLLAAKDEALSFLARRLPEDPPLEREVQAVIEAAMEHAGLAYDHPPIVAFGAHAADPHYAPSPETDRRLRPGEVVLMDLWGKRPEGPYADITWMAAWRPDPEVYRAFAAVREAQRTALELLEQANREAKTLRGFEVDRAARDVLEAQGYAAALRHRTGHNLGWQSPHGLGTHLDDFETKDTRPLIPGLAFTVEPGVYPGPFGLRLELDVYLDAHGPRITTDAQEALVVLE